MFKKKKKRKKRNDMRLTSQLAAVGESVFCRSPYNPFKSATPDQQHSRRTWQAARLTDSKEEEGEATEGAGDVENTGLELTM